MAALLSIPNSAPILVVGLGFGDEGKGSIIDALAHRSLQARPDAPPVVVRFNGGPQAAHHVVTSSGQSHCFAQLGSAGLHPGAQTLLSQHMLIEPAALLKEASALQALTGAEPLRHLTVDERCVVVTPFHKLVNRMQELARGSGRHGSCGLGIGQAWLDSRNPNLPSLRIGEAREGGALRQKLRFLQLVKVDSAEQLVDAHPDLGELPAYLEQLRRLDWVDQLSELYVRLLEKIAPLDDGARLRRLLTGSQPLLFEGAQGLLLDAERGFWPHVTPSRTSFENAMQLLDAAGYSGTPQRLGILRAYATRHGAGPFVTDDPELAAHLPEQHNLHNPWQGAMRVGWFDAVLGRYAIAAAGGVDGIALTCLDRLAGLPQVRICVGYRCLPADAATLSIPLLELCEARETPEGVLLTNLRAPRPTTRAHQVALSRLLCLCRPLYREFAGWSPPTVDGEVGARLAPAAAEFVRFLESGDGLGVPVQVLSRGPTAADKIFY